MHAIQNRPYPLSTCGKPGHGHKSEACLSCPRGCHCRYGVPHDQEPASILVLRIRASPPAVGPCRPASWSRPPLPSKLWSWHWSCRYLKACLVAVDSYSLTASRFAPRLVKHLGLCIKLFCFILGPLMCDPCSLLIVQGMQVLTQLLQMLGGRQSAFEISRGMLVNSKCRFD